MILRHLSLLLLCLLATQVHAAKPADAYDLLLESSAARVNDTFGYVAQSTVALADEYLRLCEHPDTSGDSMLDFWQSISESKGKTTAFCFDPAKTKLKSQDPVPSFYYYGSKPLDDSIAYQLNNLGIISSSFGTAYKSFNFSWVYITTSDELMLIYPYLPIDEAVNNYPPTKQIFYTCADFKNRKPGWSPPYLDLVGAGMMITVSTPVFVQDEPVAVVSRDITLKQLTNSVLQSLVDLPDAVAYIVDDTGLVIDISEPDLAAELQSVNTKHQAAVLYYLPKDSPFWPKQSAAVSSEHTWIKDATSAVLSTKHGQKVVRFQQDGRTILSTKIDATNWRLILALPITD
ncbi:hypothetical protein [Cerasicoccus maritimus]|uniref:PDC sensor domain-containing protein n=1 Tax=Cerasicoccus maritimus TaxID=490089 RepID=UPI002852B835|nr:hypothetical protein [Cerasicoccus maritimus]